MKAEITRTGKYQPTNLQGVIFQMTVTLIPWCERNISKDKYYTERHTCRHLSSVFITGCLEMLAVVTVRSQCDRFRGTAHLLTSG